MESRTSKTIRNAKWGLINKLAQLILPFIVRSVLIYKLGTEYSGLSSLFTSVLTMLSLTELGFSNAIVYSMYKPIAEDDKQTICALMRLYLLYYRIIGAIVLTIGLVLLPFIPHLVSGDVPENINIYALYLINLAATVLSYWLFAYKISLLNAHQRIDVTNKVTLYTNLVMYTVQLVILWLTGNYYLYVLVMLISQALTNVITAIVVSKMYPDYHAEGSLTPETKKAINSRIRDLFTSKLGSVIVNSTDAIVISAFLGLTVLAVYQNYYFVITAIISIITILFNACIAGIGNSLIVEKRDKNYTDFRTFTFIIAWIAGVCATGLASVIQPFILLWMGEDCLLSYSSVICFVVYFFVYEINQLLNTYKDAAGIWHEDRFRPLITAGTNLVLNIVMVQLWGLYGILLSTVIAMLVIGMPWLLHNLFSLLFNRKEVWKYVLTLTKYSVVSFISCAAVYSICHNIHIPLIPTILVNSLISLCISNLLFFIAYRTSSEYQNSIKLLKRILSRSNRKSSSSCQEIENDN